MRVRNTDYQARTWNDLTNSETHTTLSLGPDEEAEVELPEKFTDPYLTHVKSPRASKVAVPEAASDIVPKAADQ